MELIQFIFAVIVVFVVFDLYRRLWDFKRSLRVLLFFNEVINRALQEKGNITKEEMTEIGKNALYTLPQNQHGQMKKDLEKSGIDLGM